MDEADITVRNVTYAAFVELGRAPSVAEVASRAGVSPGDAAAAWRRLHDAHALVLDPTSGELRMANPFSAVPTPHRVHAGGRSWYANCAWDAFGICAALHADGRIDTTCPDCEAALAVDVVAGRAVADSDDDTDSTTSTTSTTSCSTASCRPPTGGTTSCSPEARCCSSGRTSTWFAGSEVARRARRSR